jgi:hypothetical protein
MPRSRDRTEPSVPARITGAAIATTMICVAALGVAGCGGSSSTATVAHLPEAGGAGAKSAPISPSSSDQDMLQFTRCLRVRGVEISDPYHRAGHSGLTLDLPTPSAATRPAFFACNHFIAPIAAAKAAGSAQQVATDLPALIRYARCMRTHDISMPDPGPDGELNLGPVPGLSSAYGRYTSQFRTADAACRRLLPAGVHDNGTGP